MIDQFLRFAIVGLLHCSVASLLASSAEAQVAWRQTLRLTPQAGEEYGQFGYSVTYSGDSILVGAPETSPGFGSPYGDLDKAYGFDRISGSQNADYGDNGSLDTRHLGTAVASSGEIVVVSDLGDDFESGKVLLLDESSGQLLSTLTSTQPNALERFGRSVAIGDAHVIVGATTDSFNTAGSAYLFDLATREPLLRFQESGSPLDDAYGYAVGLSTSHAFIGSPDAIGGGSVYAYSLETGSRDFEIKAPPGTGSDFGVSIDIFDDLMVVGDSKARVNNASIGAAFLFDARTGDFLHQLVAPDGHAASYFGLSVAVDDGLVVVGAMGNDEEGDFAGAAYVYDALTGDFLTKLTATDAQPGAEFGRSVDIDNGEVLVGAPMAVDNGRFGVTYAFKTLTSGDYNGDGEVSQADYHSWVNAFGRTSGDLMADGNGDGVIDAADYTVWRDAYMVAAPSTSVPEPTSLVAAVTSVVCSLASIQRRAHSRPFA